MRPEKKSLRTRNEVKEVRVAVKRRSTTTRQAHLKNEGKCCFEERNDSRLYEERRTKTGRKG